ncbi:MAG TPA: hypothetical protein VII83_08895 [Gaiellaceae bacterium]
MRARLTVVVVSVRGVKAPGEGVREPQPRMSAAAAYFVIPRL